MLVQQTEFAMVIILMMASFRRGKVLEASLLIIVNAIIIM